MLHLLQALYPDLTFMCQDNNLQTPLHAAIKAGKLEAFKYLIKKGVGVWCFSVIFWVALPQLGVSQNGLTTGCLRAST